MQGVAEQVRPRVEAAIILKSWKDPAFKKQLEADVAGTFRRELAQVDPAAKLPAGAKVRLLEETPTQLYLVVPPAAPVGAEVPKLHAHSPRTDFERTLIQRAFSDRTFKEGLFANAKAAFEQQLKSINATAHLPDALAVDAVQEGADEICLRIPLQPPEAEGAELTDAELEQAAGGVVAVGVAIVSYVVVGAFVGAVVVRTYIP